MAIWWQEGSPVVRGNGNQLGSFSGQQILRIAGPFCWKLIGMR